MALEVETLKLGGLAKTMKKSKRSWPSIGWEPPFPLTEDLQTRKPKDAKAPSCEDLLAFLQRKQASAYKIAGGKWEVCTSTHETKGTTLKNAIINSIEEHRRDGCFFVR